MASVSISGLRRNIKNVAHNYTDAQVRRGLVMGEYGVRLKTFPSKTGLCLPNFHPLFDSLFVSSLSLLDVLYVSSRMSHVASHYPTCPV